jgi:hypothetical protein
MKLKIVLIIECLAILNLVSSLNFQHASTLNLSPTYQELEHLQNSNIELEHTDALATEPKKG